MTYVSKLHHNQDTGGPEDKASETSLYDVTEGQASKTATPSVKFSVVLGSFFFKVPSNLLRGVKKQTNKKQETDWKVKLKFSHWRVKAEGKMRLLPKIYILVFLVIKQAELLHWSAKWKICI